uniref:Uncharacterized protein n=1 Tax=Vitis vinifera TaxID=29760 RepID=A5BU83_VITVI|nr:hypothetical protein VITISV_031992 [Vitis vinifera]
MVRERDINQLAFYQVLGGYQRSHSLRVKAYIYSFRGTVPLINGDEIFYVVMMIIGVSRSIITLRAAVRNHGCEPWLFAVIACKTRFTLIDDPDDYIRMEHADYPDVLWSGCIMKVVRMSVLCQRRLLFL